MKGIYTLWYEDFNIPYLGVQWTGDNFAQIRGALVASRIGIDWNDVRKDGDNLLVEQNAKTDDAWVCKLPPGYWLIWMRENKWFNRHSDSYARATFAIIEPGDTVGRKESIANDHNVNQHFMNELRELMGQHPDLPIEWIAPSDNDGYGWMGGYQFSDMPHRMGVETIARGWRHHVIIKGETAATRMDSPDDPNLEWYQAIVVRMQ